ncbi:hypothetical protein C1N61_32635 (plasmid) [Priestia aryabhattai]
MTTLEIKLEGTPPTWAKEATYYYENVHRDQWIAKKDGDTLLLAGSDMNWELITITKEMRKNILNKKPADLNINFNKEEAFWLRAVLNSFY